MPTTSAFAAARAKILLPPPPIKILAALTVGDDGATRASLETVKKRPENEPSSPVTRPLIIATDSVSFAIRLDGGRKGIPALSILC